MVHCVESVGSADAGPLKSPDVITQSPQPGPLAATATNNPLPYVTETQALSAALARIVHTMPSGDVITRDLIWVGEEESNHAQFSLLALALLIVVVAVFSFRAHLSVQLGTPAVVFTIVAIALYALGFVLHSLPSFMNEEWRLLQGLQGIAYVLAAVACALAAIHKADARTRR
jgi:hypothetical protein